MRERVCVCVCVCGERRERVLDVAGLHRAHPTLKVCVSVCVCVCLCMRVCAGWVWERLSRSHPQGVCACVCVCRDVFARVWQVCVRACVQRCVCVGW